MVIARTTLEVIESRVPYTTRNEEDQELLFLFSSKSITKTATSIDKIVVL